MSRSSRGRIRVGHPAKVTEVVARKAREEDIVRVDTRELGDPATAVLLARMDEREERSPEDPVIEEPWEDHSDCEQCTGNSPCDDEDTYYCLACNKEFDSPEVAFECCLTPEHREAMDLNLGGEA